MLWIDGLGFEYLSLLLDKLAQSEDGTVVSCTLTQALLPTETEFNEQWKQMSVPYEKLNKLDKLAHKGVVDEPDYYTSAVSLASLLRSIGSMALYPDGKYQE